MRLLNGEEAFFICAAALMQNYHFISVIREVFGVVGLPVGECLEVRLLFVVLRQVTYPQECSQHQALSGYRNKAVILHEGGCANEKRLFSVN